MPVLCQCQQYINKTVLVIASKINPSKTGGSIEVWALKEVYTDIQPEGVGSRLDVFARICNMLLSRCESSFL